MSCDLKTFISLSNQAVRHAKATNLPSGILLPLISQPFSMLPSGILPPLISKPLSKLPSCLPPPLISQPFPNLPSHLPPPSLISQLFPNLPSHLPLPLPSQPFPNLPCHLPSPLPINLSPNLPSHLPPLLPNQPFPNLPSHLPPPLPSQPFPVTLNTVSYNSSPRRRRTYQAVPFWQLAVSTLPLLRADMALIGCAWTALADCSRWLYSQVIEVQPNPHCLQLWVWLVPGHALDNSLAACIHRHYQVGYATISGLDTLHGELVITRE